MQDSGVIIKIDPDAQKEFFAAIGECLATWNMIEWHLCTLLVNLIQPANWSTVEVVFRSALSMDQKLKMVDAAANHVLIPDALQPWATLRERVKRQSRRRNDIVHFMHTQTMPEGFTDSEGHVVMTGEVITIPTLLPPLMSHMGKHPPGARYDITRIKTQKEAFAALSADLHDYVMGVARKVPKPFPQIAPATPG